MSLTTNPFDFGSASDDDADQDGDHLKEECGVFGVFGDDDAAQLTALGLHALQHRGQEAAGIATYDGEVFQVQRSVGHVNRVFRSEAAMERLAGSSAVGHVRYSTAGGSNFRNIQPLYADFAFGGLAMGHNGNLTNAVTLRRELVERGSLFQSTSDTETIIHLIARSEGATVVERVIDALKQVEGAYSLVALTQNKLMGVRDPRGIRPLSLGKLDNAWILSSETCAFDLIGADFVRDIEPGELVVIDEEGVHSHHPFPKQPSAFCIFEYIYFSRPDSVVDGLNVYNVRKEIGKHLARESHVDADVIVPVPDSGVPAALGYAAESGIPFEYGIIRNHYVGRTFIQPTDKTRHVGVKRKHNANRDVIAGKRIVLIDDSIVRGTTSIKIVDMMRQAGATEVHLRISSPPTAHPCFYGIDTPEREKLLAARHADVQEMAKELGVESLAFISVDGLYKAVGHTMRNTECPQYCDACFTSDYPVEPTDVSDPDGPRQLSLLNEKHND